MTRHSALIGAVLLSLAAGQALAASHSRDTFIAEEDADHDGKVGKDEFAAGRLVQFKHIDTNGDGRLSSAEYVGEFKARLEAGRVGGGKPDTEGVKKQLAQAETRFGVLDSNKDGVISAAEFDYSGWTMFIHHDTNKDGAVSKTDFIED